MYFELDTTLYNGRHYTGDVRFRFQQEDGKASTRGADLCEGSEPPSV